jgi:hypothetical protein
VQVSRTLQRCSATRANRGTGIRSNELDAQPSDNGFSVVFVQTVQGEAVVEQSCHLEDHLTSHLEIHLRTSLGDCLRGRQELIERWTHGAGRHAVKPLSIPDRAQLI